MPLLSDELSVREVSFRWAGYDPGKFRFRTPLAVKDNFRNIMAAILSGHLDCSTLSLEKRNPQEANSSPPEFFIRHYMDEVYDCVSGRKFDRKLLDWASDTRRGQVFQYHMIAKDPILFMRQVKINRVMATYLSVAAKEKSHV